ncbi:MAG: type II-A CRISPR-associated protein Csn2 [Clostridia bacterium]|nr:type II-A CRISPR-associated protein Csn2 [Clostridia bacterium]
MRLTHFAFDKSFEWEGQNVCSLIIENPIFYRNAIKSIQEQSTLGVGEFVLSDNDCIVPFERNVELISDVFNIDPCANKTIINGIIKDSVELFTHQYPDRLAEVYMNINTLLSDVCFHSASELTFDEINDVSVLLKAYHLRPDIEGLSLAERLLLYMELCQKYTKKKLFVTVNLRACLSDVEAENLYKDLIYRKLNLLSIECMNSKKLDCEQRKILDIDMCEI